MSFHVEPGGLFRGLTVSAVSLDTPPLPLPSCESKGLGGPITEYGVQTEHLSRKRAPPRTTTEPLEPLELSNSHAPPLPLLLQTTSSWLEILFLAVGL